MDEIKAGLQYAFQTESKYTLLISGTGHAGMELCLANMLEPGQKVIIGNNGALYTFHEPHAHLLPALLRCTSVWAEMASCSSQPEGGHW